MALPNPTKTNYGNVDDITPAEMNDIGSNLVSLGQKIVKVVDDTWIFTNADHDGVNFIRIDIAKAATALQVGIDGTLTSWRVAAGANPIAWTMVFKFNSSGTLTVGTVPGARIPIKDILSGHIADNQILSAHIAMNQVLSAHVAANQIGSAHLKTAPGSASGSLIDSEAISISLNNYSFYPNFAGQGGFIFMMDSLGQGGGSEFATFAIKNSSGVGPKGYSITWKYITASDDPTTHIVHNLAGDIVGAWMSDDPLPPGEFGISGEGLTSLIIPRVDLELMLTGIPQAKIEQGRRKSTSANKVPYRIIHEAFKKPTDELRLRCKILGGKLVAK